MREVVLTTKGCRFLTVMERRDEFLILLSSRGTCTSGWIGLELKMAILILKKNQLGVMLQTELKLLKEPCILILDFLNVSEKTSFVILILP